MKHTYDEAREDVVEFIGCAVRDGLVVWCGEAGRDDHGLHASLIPHGPLYFQDAAALQQWSIEHDHQGIIRLPGWCYVRETDGHHWYIESSPTVGIKWSPGRGWRGVWPGCRLEYWPDARILIGLALTLAPLARIYEDDLRGCWLQDGMASIPLGRQWWRTNYPSCRDLFDAWEQVEDDFAQWLADGSPEDRTPEQQAEDDRTIQQAIERACQIIGIAREEPC